MAIYVTDGAGVATEVTEVYIGPALMGSVYAGSDLIWQVAQNYTMTGGENLNIAAFITAQTPNPAFPVVVNIPDTEVIGSADAAIPALVSGDLSMYTKGVTVYNFAEIQGAGGAAGQAGGVALQVTSDMTLVNAAGAAIRGGGGGGGRGGNGGKGNQLPEGDWSAWRYDRASDRFAVYVNNWVDKDEPEWSNTDLTSGGPVPANNYFIFTNRKDGEHTYERGNYRSTHDSGNVLYYEIRRHPGYPVEGTIGNGGNGGRGQGYNQSRQDGSNGTDGNLNAGDGGVGGGGGVWGQDGTDGATGEAGELITIYGRQNQNGAQGQSGGSAGAAIDASAATLTLLGSGTVAGPVL